MEKLMFGRRIMASCLLGTLGLAGGSVFAADAVAYVGITNPSEQRGLNFNVPGVVSKICVKEGDIVKFPPPAALKPVPEEVDKQTREKETEADRDKRDKAYAIKLKDWEKQQKQRDDAFMLAKEDDSVDVAELAVKQAEADSSRLQIDAARADLAQKRVELERSRIMFGKNVIGKSELEKAELDVTIGVIRVALAEQETQQKYKEVDAERAKIEQKKFFSTIEHDAVVQKINVHEGELATNDPKTPCIQLVCNYPLWVEVDVPVADAKALALDKGTLMEVCYTGETQWQTAPIIYVNPVVNAAAGTQRIRLELDNNTRKLRSGLQVDVRLKAKNGVAGPGAGQ